jgi:hypothetical protein
MHPKPPVTRTGRFGWLGTTRLKSLAVAGVVTLGFAGAGIAAAMPASADPAFQFVGVGSDTTEFMMDAFAGQVSGGVVASYDAVNPSSSQAIGETILPAIASPTSAGAQTQCAFTRPNGSGNGFAFLDTAFNPSSTLSLTVTGGPPTPIPAAPGCITFSRSSSGPGGANQGHNPGPGNLDPTGLFVYIPFAVDAVTDVTSPTTATSETINCQSTTTGCTNGQITFTTTPTKITTANQFTLANLQNLYAKCGVNPAPNDFVTVGGINYYPNNDAPTGIASDVNINLYVPQSGSGTLSFWLKVMGNLTAITSCMHQTVLAGPGVGDVVEEHDGTAVASDPNGLEPMSIARWVGSNNGVLSPDLRHGAVLQPIVVGTTTVQPTLNGSMNVTGCGATFNQADCFPINREVYNVLPYNEVVNSTGDTSFNPTLAGLFVGQNSFLCSSNFTISTQGFGNLPSTLGSVFPDLCGSTASTLRVSMMNTGD